VASSSLGLRLARTFTRIVSALILIDLRSVAIPAGQLGAFRGFW
jgi:hypothetical protein